MYKITVNGRAIKYATFEAALAVASEIFDKTGVVVGIERV